MLILIFGGLTAYAVALAGTLAIVRSGSRETETIETGESKGPRRELENGNSIRVAQTVKERI